MSWSHALVAAQSFALLALVFVPLERVVPARPGQPLVRRDFATDACFFFGQYLVWSSVALVVLRLVHRQVMGVASFPAPLWLQGVSAVVAGDVLVYWFHRACHHFSILWRFHAVHHSAEQLDWLAAHREHPVDGILTQLCQNLPAMLIGLPIEALAVLAIFRGAWGIFLHSNVQLSIGPLRYLLGAPELHHWHHARLHHTAHNFANLAPWLDVVFGTYHRPTGPERYPLGLVEAWPRGYLAQLVWPCVPARARRGLALRASDEPVA